DQVTLYWDDALEDPLPIGTLGLRALVYEKYLLAMSHGLLSEVFDTSVTTTELAEAGYLDLLEDDDAWLPSGRMSPDDEAFYLPLAHTDPFGNATTLNWDADALALTDRTDPVGLVTSYETDYHTMQPKKETEPNGTETVLTVDPLGRPLTVAIRNGSHGDGLGAHSAEFNYEALRWEEHGTPVRVHARLREAHGGSEWLERYTYADGSGQVVQEKVEAAPGLAPERDSNGELVFVDDVLQFAHADP